MKRYSSALFILPSLYFLNLSFGVILRLKVHVQKIWKMIFRQISSPSIPNAAQNKNIVPKSSAHMIKAISARNQTKAMITMKQVIVFYVLMYLLLRPTNFFFNLPNKAIKHPMKAVIRNGNGKIPISLMVKSTQAVASLLVLQPSGQPLTHLPSLT